jgi:preprotein translocase subunit SecD
MVRALMTAMSIAAVLGLAGSPEAVPDDQQRVEVELRRAQEVPAEGFEKRTLAGTGETLYVARKGWRLSREDVTKSEVTDDERGRVAVAVEFTKRGRANIGKLTEGWIDKRLAVFVDGKIVSTPVIKSKIDNAVLISGVTSADAHRIVKALSPK